MTGFRVSCGAPEPTHNIDPDLTALGKIIPGAGMPVGAFGGKKKVMQHIAPTGPVYQAGTLSGNPVAMAAGLTMLDLLLEPGLYEQLSAKTARVAEGSKPPPPGTASRLPSTTWAACSASSSPTRPRSPALRAGDPLRHGTLQALLPSDAGRGCLSGTEAPRGGLPVAGPRGQGD